MADKPLFDRIVVIFQNWLDQIMMILNLATLDDSVETRLTRLRHIYYDDLNVNITHRRVKDVLRGHVDQKYYPYYERLLSAERTAHRNLKSLPRGVGGHELLYQMEKLGKKIAELLEQVQNADHTEKLYQADSMESGMITESRVWLMERIEQAMLLHNSIPARLLAFGKVTAGRGIDKIDDRIARLTNQINDVVETYNELDQNIAAHERESLTQEINETISKLENHS